MVVGSCMLPYRPDHAATLPGFTVVAFSHLMGRTAMSTLVGIGRADDTQRMAAACSYAAAVVRRWDKKIAKSRCRYTPTTHRRL